MKLKYLALFILFIVNFSATVLADSSHFDFPTSTNSEIHHEHSDEADSKHCSEHDCCHQNHIHYYLLPLLSAYISTPVLKSNFPDYLAHFLAPSFDIIKPPLV